MTVTGQPRIGQRIAFSWACRSNADLPLLLFAHTLPVGFVSGAIACNPNGCGVISLLPSLFVQGAAGRTLTVATVLPPDPTLIGFTFHAQGACAARACVDFSVGVSVRIMR